MPWLPDGAPKAAVVIVHGIAEHCGRYAPLAGFLASRGYGVQTFALRGHGRSGGPRARIEDFGQYTADAESAIDALVAGAGKLPLFLIGHSMGSLIALEAALRSGDGMAGVISSGTPLALADLPVALRGLAGILSRAAPGLPLLRLSSAAVCRDPRVVADYDTDPLNYRGRLRARVVHELIAHACGVRARLDRLRVPLLVLHGGSDRLAAPSGSRSLFERAASADKTLKIYPGLFHEIFNEPERETVFADIVDWLDRRSPRGR